MKCKICHSAINNLDVHNLKIQGDKIKYSLEMELNKMKVCESCYAVEYNYLKGHIEKSHQILTTGKGNHKEVVSEINKR